MDEQSVDLLLSFAMLLGLVGLVEMFFGQVFVAAHAWKKNPLYGILVVLVPPITIYWGVGPYKNDAQESNRPLRLAMYFSGLVVVLLSLGVIHEYFKLVTFLGISMMR